MFPFEILVRGARTIILSLCTLTTFTIVLLPRAPVPQNSMTVCLVLCSFCSILVVVTGLWYLYWFRCSRTLKGVPGPFPLPFIGNALKFPNSDSFLSGMCNIMETYGPVFKLIVGLEPSITIADPVLLEKILSSSELIEKATPYRHFRNWLGEGLLTSGGTKWKKRRKTITPAYHFQILDQFIATFEALSNVLLQELDDKCCDIDQGFDVYPFITLCTLDIICETAMGTSVNAQINRDSDYVRSVKKMCKIIMERTFSPLQQFDIAYKFTQNCRNEKNCLNILNEYSMSVIRHRRNELEASIPRSNEKEGRRKVAFLDLLLQSSMDGDSLSDEDIREEVSTFMFEGHDTTASALGFALFSIAQHRDVQEKLYEEQVQLFGQSIRSKLTHRDLNEMKYLEMVIKETLRLYPPVPFYGRQTKQAIKISDTITLPKGIIINIFAFGVHRSIEHFVQPEKFEPERFSQDRSCIHHPYSFIPFSAGPRNCIGQKFAMLEMKVVLSKIIRSFVLKPVRPEHRLQLISETILKSSNGIRISIKRR